MNKSTAIALTIAGSDSGGGAGVQADLKAFSALGVYGASVITAVTAQNTRGVSAVHLVPRQVVQAQIEAVLDDLEVKAVKIGMLGSAEIIETVATQLRMRDIPVVLDPVMVAKSGDILLAEDAIDALKTHLIPLAAVVTPNLPEAARLVGEKTANEETDMLTQGRRLLESGCGAVLMKGGHARGPRCVDLLIRGAEVERFHSDRISTKNTHGTGCSLSSAIAAGIAGDLSLIEAVSQAHAYLNQAIRRADELTVGSGHGPVNHFFRYW